MPKKTSTEYVRKFRERQRANKPPKQPPKTSSERCREYRARKKALQNAALAGDLPQSSALPTVASPDVLRDPPIQTLMALDVPYSNFAAHERVRKEIEKKFSSNPFGHVCNICERLWFECDLKTVLESHHELLQAEFLGVDVTDFKACQCCFTSLNRHRVPTYSYEHQMDLNTRRNLSICHIWICYRRD